LLLCIIVYYYAALISLLLLLFVFNHSGVLEEGLARTLPDVKLDSVVLNDADLKSAVQFVSASVGAAAVTKDTADAVAVCARLCTSLLYHCDIARLKHG